MIGFWVPNPMIWRVFFSLYLLMLKGPPLATYNPCCLYSVEFRELYSSRKPTYSYLHKALQQGWENPLESALALVLATSL